MKQEIKSYNPNFITNHPIYSCIQRKCTPITIIKKKKGKSE